MIAKNLAFVPSLIRCKRGEQDAIQWAVILDGTNDPNLACLGEDIYEALQNVWAYPMQNGTKVLSLTAPEYEPCPPGFAKQKDDFTLSILGHEEEDL